MKSWIEDEEYDGERVLSREFDTLMMDFIEPYADRLGIEYCYDDYWRMHITKIEKVGTNPHWIAGSEIAVIRKDKNQIFIICCQPVVKCAGSFSNNNYYFVDYLQINPTF